MDIFDIFAAASFEYAVYSNLAATDPINVSQYNLLLYLIILLTMIQLIGSCYSRVNFFDKIN